MNHAGIWQFRAAVPYVGEFQDLGSQPQRQCRWKQRRAVLFVREFACSGSFCCRFVWWFLLLLTHACGGHQTPYITSCKHVYCYYCLQTAVATDEEFLCAACGAKFDSSQRLRL